MKKIKIRKAKVKQIEQPKKAHILCIILKEGKGSKWIWLPEDEERFSLDGHTYFKVDDGTYLKNILRMMVYLEGISLPIHHGYIDYETKEIEIKNRETGKKEKRKLRFIKGLKFDSKIMDVILNNELAREFTRQHMDIPNLILIIMLIISVMVGIINIGMWYL